MRVANAYGMIQPGASDTSAVRATFISDPAGILRAMVYYPMSNGRSVVEFLRLVETKKLGADPAGLEILNHRRPVSRRLDDRKNIA